MEGAELPARMRHCSPWVPNVLYTVGGAFLTPTGLVSTWWGWWGRGWWIVLAALTLLYATLLAYARSQEEQTLETRHQIALARLEAEHRLEWKKFLRNDLLNLLIIFGAALFEDDPGRRPAAISKARDRTVQMAANVVGRRGSETRACLYRFNGARTELKPVGLAYAGRGTPPSQVFTAAHETFREIAGGSYVYEPALDDGVVEAENLTYKTFIAYPVSIGVGPRFPIYGALMVDSPKEGDLDKVVDLAKVTVLSALIAATYMAS
jgi:hypothetical protein